MRTVGKLVGLVATSALVAGPAFASSSVDDELAEMRDLVKGLEQKVDAQQEQIEHQSGLLEDAQKVVREEQKQDQEQGALSGMSEFWQAIDVNMSVAGSYAYNFRNPNDGDPGRPGADLNQGRDSLFYPFHGDHNSFQVDQVWFDIGKETTAESRAGFHTTILYGNTASFLGQGGNDHPRRDVNDSTSDYYVHQAYVNYLANVGEGVQFTFGKFATPIGAETADASKNWAITRGNVYNILQPIDHLGLMASTTAGPVTFGAAVVNQINFATSSPDVNSEKSYLGRIAFAPGDMFSIATTVAYGADGATVTGGNDNGDKIGLLDVLANFNSDAFSAYINADYAWLEGHKAAAWGVSVAGQVPLTEMLSAALRLEYLRDKDDAFGILDDAVFIGNGVRHSDIYGATGTIAYEIAENLTLKGEARWDKVHEDAGGAHEFLNHHSTSNGTEDQVVGLAQVVYAF
jgi:putative OmpL-like beta-barrel porin-2